MASTVATGPDVSRMARGGGVLLALSGSVILLGIITAEALYPRAYRTDVNTISDLGGTRPPERLVVQPSAAIFDTTMVATGILTLVAAVLLHRSLHRRIVTIPVAVLGAGLLGVGLFPGDTTPHPVFAYAAFLGGGFAALLSGRTAPAPLRHLCTGLGSVSLGALVLGSLLLSWEPVAELGEGGIERWVAYPVVLWLAVFGGHLAGSAPASAPRTVVPAGRTHRRSRHSVS